MIEHEDDPMKIGNFFVSLDVCEHAQWERGGCGLSLRIGHVILAFGHYDYREKNCPWPRWLRFGAAIGGPVATSMSWRRVNYLYLFGHRVFDTTYWSDARRMNA
jgi:hypothetical protein